MSPALLEVQLKSLRRQLEQLELAVVRERDEKTSTLSDYRGAWIGKADATDADLDEIRYSFPAKKFEQS